MNEAERQSRIMLAVGALPGVRVFRNTTGVGFTGTEVKGTPDLVILRNARRVTFGLCVGSADLIGWHSVVVSPDMVGRRVALFLAGEIKTPTGQLSDTQRNFARVVSEAGGIAATWRTPDDALATLL